MRFSPLLGHCLPSCHGLLHGCGVLVGRGYRWLLVDGIQRGFLEWARVHSLRRLICRSLLLDLVINLDVFLHINAWSLLLLNDGCLLAGERIVAYRHNGHDFVARSAA